MYSITHSLAQYSSDQACLAKVTCLICQGLYCCTGRCSMRMRHIPAVYTVTETALKSAYCTGVAEPSGDCCSDCSSIANRVSDIKAIVQRANDTAMFDSNSKYIAIKYLTLDQVSQKAKHLRQPQQATKLRVVTSCKLKQNLQHQVDLHRSMMVALSQKHVPRLKQLLSVGLRNG